MMLNKEAIINIKRPVLTWLAIGAGAVVVLLLAWWALSGGGFDLDNRFPLGSEQGREQTRQEGTATSEEELNAALEQAKQRLAALQIRMETEQVSDEMIEEVQDIRVTLAAAYEDANAEAKEKWRKLDEGLEDLEQNLRKS